MQGPMKKGIHHYHKIIKADECRCGHTKKTGYPLCFRCYHSLPEEMRRALHQPIGQGFEAAYEAAVDELEGDEVLTRVKDARCPYCGGEVYVPSFASQYVKHTRDNPIVLCKDMGHWLGLLSECKKKGEKVHMTLGKVISSQKQSW